MLFDIAPVLLIFVATAVIVAVFARRLPEIAALNIQTMPEARAAEVKRRLLVERLQRRLRHAAKAGRDRLRQWRQAVVLRAAKAHETLVVLEERYRTKPPAVPRAGGVAPAARLEDDRADLLGAADHGQLAHRYEAAEREYLDAIRRDPRNAEAYRGLGILYAAQGQGDEARQALEFSLKLHEDAATAAALGILQQTSGSFPAAVAAFEQAVALAPTDARYLDQLLDASILVGNRRLARTTLVRLEAVDADYPTLPDRRRAVAALMSRPRPSPAPGPNSSRIKTPPR